MFECFGGESFKRIKLVSFDIVLCGMQVYYRPGSEVSGKCVIHLNGEMNLNQLEIKLEGKTNVSWHEGRGGTRSASAHCLQLSYCPDSYNPRIIKCGEHCIPFSIRLPDSNIASSFEGDYGSIRYRMKAEIRQPKVLSHNYKTQLPIAIRSPANVSAQQLKTRRVFEMEQTVGFCCTKGWVSLKCETTCGQKVGKSADIRCYVENRSNSHIRLRVKLKQMIDYSAGLSHHKLEKTIINSVGPYIQPNSIIDNCLSLKIPAELPVSQSQCSLINIKYQIVVTLDVRFSSDLRAYLPIIVSN